MKQITELNLYELRWRGVRLLERMIKRKPSLIELKEWFLREFNYNPDDTLESELIAGLVLPLRHTFLKFNPYIIKRHVDLTALRMYFFTYTGWDYFASITATEGKGKSTLAFLLTSKLKKLGLKFSEQTLFFRNTPMAYVIKAINELKKHVLWFDEAKSFFEKREFMTKTRIAFLKDITAQRKNYNVYLLLLGDWRELDIYFRERRLRENILVIDRGFYTSLFNTSVLGVGNDRFYFSMFERYAMKYPFQYNYQVKVLSQLPSNIGFGTYPRVIGKDWERYLRLKEIYNSRTAFEKMKEIVGTQATISDFTEFE